MYTAQLIPMESFRPSSRWLLVGGKADATNAESVAEDLQGYVYEYCDT
jgi:hypothetical protein